VCVIAAPVLQVTASVIIALFLIVTAKRFTASSTNPILSAANDGLTYITS
jgi:hypothetical protein